MQSSGHIPIYRKIKAIFPLNTDILCIGKNNTEALFLRFVDVKFQLLKILASLFMIFFLDRYLLTFYVSVAKLSLKTCSIEVIVC